MSFNAKTITVSVAALLAVAGGLYAFLPDDQKSVAASPEMVGSVEGVAKPEATDARAASNGQSSAPANVQVTAVVQQPSVEDRPVSQAPKKLTKAQLTPPPATEEEKLQRAAEQESNF